MTPDEELAALRRLADDEWTFEPFGIRLSGGPHDGRELRVRNRPEVWMMPMPVAPSSILLELGDHPSAISPAPVALYNDAHEIDDDGWCLYKFDRIA